MEELNCIKCKYCNLNNIEYSKFCDNYVRFECRLKGYTQWTDTETNDKLICNDFEMEE